MSAISLAIQWHDDGFMVALLSACATDGMGKVYALCNIPNTTGKPCWLPNSIQCQMRT